MADISVQNYAAGDFDDCLRIFDANCPEFFAENERADYVSFLRESGEEYRVCFTDGRACGAFGLLDDKSDGHAARRLNWIMIDPAFQGMGLGTAIMSRAISMAVESGAALIRIAASHKSAPFFARFNATVVKTTEDGWGKGMHRVDMELRVDGGLNRQG
ncbi:MAG: GNAT family N-acetyltransferase [Planctomycetota bacterium]